MQVPKVSEYNKFGIPVCYLIKRSHIQLFDNAPIICVMKP